MSLVVLIEATPRDPATGQAVDVRLAGGGSRPYTHRGFNDWRAGVANLPRFTAEVGFDETGWTGGAIPQTAEMRFCPAERSVFDRLAGLYWNNAKLTVRVGDDRFADPVFTVVMVATVAKPDASDGVLTLTIGDFAVDLGKPLLTDRFTGKGGLEGGEDATERVKRRTWGRAFNVEGFVLDKANNIYEFGDPTKALQAFDVVKDKGRAGSFTVLAWQGSAAATFSALQAAKPPGGGAVVAPSIACIKWWTQPAGPLTADIRGEVGAGYVETVPEIAAAIIAARSTLTVANVSAMTAVRAGVAGVHVSEASETVAQVLDRILLGVSLLWTLEPSGVVRLSEWRFFNNGAPSPIAWTRTGTSAGPTWRATGSGNVAWQAPASIETLRSEVASRRMIYPPIKTRRLAYQRNHRLMGDGEIAAGITGVFVTLSKPAATLPAGNGGTVSDFAQAAGTILVRSSDGVDLAPQAAFRVAAQNNLAGSVNSGGAYSVTALAADSGSLDMIANFGGVDYPVSFAVAKARQGDVGATGAKGDTGNVGPQGRSAVVFHQDGDPAANGNVTDGDTWITVTEPSKFYKREGGKWVQLLGDLAGLSLIQRAYIASAAIGSAQIDNLAVNTIHLAGGAVTASARVVTTSTFAGNGAWQEVASFTYPLGFDGEVDVRFNAEQGYAAGVRGYGLRIKIDGNVVKSFPFSNRAGFADILTMLRDGVAVRAGNRVFSVEWYGADNTQTLGNIDFTATRRFA